LRARRGIWQIGVGGESVGRTAGGAAARALTLLLRSAWFPNKNGHPTDRTGVMRRPALMAGRLSTPRNSALKAEFRRSSGHPFS